MTSTETLYTIEKPLIPKNWERHIMHLSHEHKRFLIDFSENPDYLYWDTFKYKKMENIPVSKETAWAFIDHHRRMRTRATPIQSDNGTFFSYVPLQRWDTILHRFDTLFLNTPFQKNKPVESWMMEAISSAMIEGAHTTRERALNLLRLRKTPSDYSERMIFNNYKMAEILENLPPDFEVSVPTLLEWQTKLTHSTIDAKDQGRMRNDDDHIVIAPKSPEIITFIPPKKAFLDHNIDHFLLFLNTKDSTFHPLIHAICVHFWFAYLHPFVDGNGRTARALFYWFLMKSSYPNITSLPLSPLILKSLKHYSKAFIYSEQDQCDLTYFIDFNMRLIDQALNHYTSIHDTSHHGAPLDESLNGRQNTIMALLKKKDVDDVNVSFVIQRFGVSKLTAINDLKELMARGLVDARRVGKNVLYRLK